MDTVVLLVAVFGLAVLALLAQAFGQDSRDWKPDERNRPWL
jgi:hypothetical protein